MKFLLLRFALKPLVVVEVDEFVKIVGSYLIISTLILGGNV